MDDPELIDVGYLKQLTQQFEQQKFIDPTSNLQNHVCLVVHSSPPLTSFRKLPLF